MKKENTKQYKSECPYMSGNMFLVSRLISVRAEAEGKRFEEVLEEALMGAFVPHHREAQYFTRLLLDDKCVASGYKRVFGYYASGLDTDAKALGGGPVVEEFAKLLRNSDLTGQIEGHEGDLEYLNGKLDSISEYVIEQTGGQSERLATLVKQMAETPERKVMADLVEEILHWWDVLENKSTTFRALVSMASICADWVVVSSADDICTLIDVMAVVSEQWP